MLFFSSWKRNQSNIFHNIKSKEQKSPYTHHPYSYSSIIHNKNNEEKKKVVKNGPKTGHKHLN